MAEDDQDRASEMEAEREAEIESEMERVGQNPAQVSEGSDSLGTQSADSGEPRADETPSAEPDDAATSQEDAQELPNEQQDEQWAESGGDEQLAEDAVEGTDATAEADPEDDEVAEPVWAEGADDDLAEGLMDDGPAE